MSLILLFLVTFTQVYTGIGVGAGGTVDVSKVAPVCKDNVGKCVVSEVKNVKN